jgi:hypothetical protein
MFGFVSSRLKFWKFTRRLKLAKNRRDAAIKEGVPIEDAYDGYAEFSWMEQVVEGEKSDILRRKARRYDLALPPQADDNYWDNIWGSSVLNARGRSLVRDDLHRSQERRYVWMFRTVSIVTLSLQLIHYLVIFFKAR